MSDDMSSTLGAIPASSPCPSDVSLWWATRLARRSTSGSQPVPFKQTLRFDSHVALFQVVDELGSTLPLCLAHGFDDPHLG